MEPEVHEVTVEQQEDTSDTKALDESPEAHEVAEPEIKESEVSTAPIEEHVAVPIPETEADDLAEKPGAEETEPQDVQKGRILIRFH